MLDYFMNINLNHYFIKADMIKKTLLTTAAFLVSILICYGQDDPSDLLVGKWTKEMDGRTFTLNLLPDHKYEVEFAGDDRIDVYGSYEVSGTQITFSDESGEYSSGTAGVYEFKVSEAVWTLTAVNDPVDGRRMLVVGSWSKASD